MSKFLNDKRIFLIGPMGAGKSSIGKSLALVSERSFLDIDEEIVRYSKKSIPQIFEEVAEAGFRKIETEVLKRSLRYEAVIATGGGIVVTPENLEILKQNGVVVYLYANVDTQYLRTQHDTNRPMINTEDRKARLQEIFDKRAPLYRQIADITIDTGAHSLHDCVELLKTKLGIK